MTYFISINKNLLLLLYFTIYNIIISIDFFIQKKYSDWI